LFVALTSSIELAFGVVVPIPTLCAKEDVMNTTMLNESRKNFFMMIVFGGLITIIIMNLTE
jgi:uncharacterized membrane protein